MVPPQRKEKIGGVSPLERGKSESGGLLDVPPFEVF